jgi:YVTN family beta-propeller protein
MIATGTVPVSVAVDPAGKFAYVTNSASNDVSIYSIDAATGALTLIGTIGT